jgi:2-dehydro-3-deoxy-D-arabinonate dehydratase
MNVVRYRRLGAAEEDVRVGILDGEDVRLLPGVESLAQLWSLRLAELRSVLLDIPRGNAFPAADVHMLAPVDGRTEVWAAGVTYKTSREARVEESQRAATVYELVYDAQRPELFFKSVAWRAVGPDGYLRVRADSVVDVPEPELALVINRFGEIVGYTICNDMSSRSIEGENPLYLPQAKMYQGACGLGPWIRPAWEVDDPYRLDIELTIWRDGATAWNSRANTSRLHRRLDDLVSYLMRGDVHPDGVVLSTGTCLVPPAPFTLVDGDRVEITIEGIGTLTNPVLRAAAGQPAAA